VGLGYLKMKKSCFLKIMWGDFSRPDIGGLSTVGALGAVAPTGLRKSWHNFLKFNSSELLKKQYAIPPPEI
jgi:hypothetical protein